MRVHGQDGRNCLYMLGALSPLTQAKHSAPAPPLYPQILPGLYVGGAVTADSHHLLRHMGITHIVNTTEEVLPPPASAGFQVRASLSCEGGGGRYEGLHRQVSRGVTAPHQG